MQCLFIVLLFAIAHTSVFAQQRSGQGGAFYTSVVENELELSVNKSSLMGDTLRNFTPGGTIFGYFANSVDQLGGWIHGTNEFEDIAKATRLTATNLPDGALLTEVIVTFIYKSPTVTNQTYSIDIYDVASTGAPGSIIASQTYNMSDIVADADFGTPAEFTRHRFDPGIVVPQQFFVSVNFGSYDSDDYENIAIAASPNLGRFVAEDWEFLSPDEVWFNMSESWFTNNDDGWYMWISAIVEPRANNVPQDPNEPNNNANQATVIADDYVSSETSINPIGDVDYYVFEGIAGQSVDIFTENAGDSQLDGLIQLYNSSGVFLDENDDNGSTDQSRLQFSLPETDTYYIRYSHFDNTSQGFPNKTNKEHSFTESRKALLAKSTAIEASAHSSDLSNAFSPVLEETGEYTLSFQIAEGGEDILPPVINHVVSNTEVTFGEDVVIEATITDDSAITSVQVAYVEGGTGANEIVIIRLNESGGGLYRGVIPGSDINANGLQYLIIATDGPGNQALGDVINLIVRLDDGLSRAVTVNGTDAGAYRLISMPLNLDDASARAVLEDDFGAYNTENWRFYELSANQQYAQYPAVSPMLRGRGFWLATSQSGQMLTTGPGTTASLEFVTTIPLNPGWTFIGTPYAFPVEMNQVALSSDEDLDIRSFQGSWSDISGPMMPFQGYAVASVAGGELTINPFIVTATKTEQSSSKDLATDTSFDWAIQITASSTSATDNDNQIGVAAGASVDWDPMDRPEPPVIGDYISLYFPHRDWDVPFEHFNTDVRPSFDTIQHWKFEVQASINEPITLSFED